MMTAAAKTVGWTIGAFVVLGGLLWQTLPDWYGFEAQWHTFYWDSEYWSEQLGHHGGFGRLCQDFWLQFMERRTSAACAWALPCMLLFWVLASLLRKTLSRWNWGKKLTKAAEPISLLIVGVGAWLLLCNGSQPITSAQRFKAQMCMAANEEWEKIIAQSLGQRLDNALELNLRNMALAETDQLTNRLKEQPYQDIKSLVVLEIGSPYISAMLSDIYWTMGEISMSQMYAFETNEKIGNLSPRLLKRLVLTNIVFGHYKVAEKYLNWLDKTLYHREWAQHYRTLLSDEAVEADPTLSVKRRCIPRQNCFPSLQSVRYDLQLIVDENPAHKPSKQYLEAINMIYGVQ